MVRTTQRTSFPSYSITVCQESVTLQRSCLQSWSLAKAASAGFTVPALSKHVTVSLIKCSTSIINHTHCINKAVSCSWSYDVGRISEEAVYGLGRQTKISTDCKSSFLFTSLQSVAELTNGISHTCTLQSVQLLSLLNKLEINKLHSDVSCANQGEIIQAIVNVVYSHQVQRASNCPRGLSVWIQIWALETILLN